MTPRLSPRTDTRHHKQFGEVHCQVGRHPDSAGFDAVKPLEEEIPVGQLVILIPSLAARSAQSAELLADLVEPGDDATGKLEGGGKRQLLPFHHYWADEQ